MIFIIRLLSGQRVLMHYRESQRRIIEVNAYLVELEKQWKMKSEKWKIEELPKDIHNHEIAVMLQTYCFSL